MGQHHKYTTNYYIQSLAIKYTTNYYIQSLAIYNGCRIHEDCVADFRESLSIGCVRHVGQHSEYTMTDYIQSVAIYNGCKVYEDCVADFQETLSRMRQT